MYNFPNVINNDIMYNYIREQVSPFNMCLGLQNFHQLPSWLHKATSHNVAI